MGIGWLNLVKSGLGDDMQLFSMFHNSLRISSAVGFEDIADEGGST